MPQLENMLYELPSPEGLDHLIKTITMLGYDVIGPTVRDQTVALGPVRGAGDLPRGYTDTQEKGSYRLNRSDMEPGFFGFNLGPTSWKSYLFPERRKLWHLKHDGHPEATEIPARPLAFFGMRACELAAIAVQDRLFLRDGGDPYYRARRQALLIVGVHCRTAAATCFCPSMGTGPEFSAPGWDLLLTEDADRFFLAVGSEKGRALLDHLTCGDAPDDARAVIERQLGRTRSLIARDGRQMPQEGIKEAIYQSMQSPRWDEIGSRCLACANCTLVCPTCFCSTVEDVSDVAGEQAERWQTWDSCFHSDFSYVHGGSRRPTIATRYRQWFTHKLATWIDQFGTSGCVGCGRCISWCPVGIDITEEMAAFRQDISKKDDAGAGP